MTEQVKLESICPSCGKTDKLLWPDGCKNTWHIEGCGTMSEIQRYIAKVQELPKSHKTYIADEIVVRNDAHLAALRERDERIAALEAENGITKGNLDLAIDCVKQLQAENARLSAPVTDVEWACANYQQGFSTGIVSTKEGEPTVMNWQQFTTRELINALIAARKGAA